MVSSANTRGFVSGQVATMSSFKASPRETPSGSFFQHSHCDCGLLSMLYGGSKGPKQKCILKMELCLKKIETLFKRGSDISVLKKYT